MSEARAEVVEEDDYSGQLPVGWLPTQLGEICEVLDKHRVPLNAKQRAERKRNAKALYPYYGATGQVDEIDDYLFDGEHVLIGEDGAPFFDRNKDTAYIVDGKFWVNNHAHIIRGLDGISNRFLRHQLNVIDYHGFVSGTTRLKLTQAALRELPIKLAPTAEQERIVSKIDELFSDIEAGERALKRARAALARYRKSVLKAAVTGDLTADWRAANKDRLEPADKLLTRILAARREAWEKAERAKLKAQGKSPKGEEWRKRYREPRTVDDEPTWQIPEEWTWASPVELEAIERNALTIGPFGSNLKVSDYRDSGVPLIFVRHIRLGDFTGHDPKFIDHEKAEELATHKARGGDIVITKMGDPPGDAAIYPKSAPDAIITADCIKWTTNCEAGEVAYFAMFINSALCAAQIADITKGVAQQKVSLDRFRGLAIALPPKDEQAEIISRVEEAFSKADHVEAALDEQARAARALKQSILKAAFEGRLVPQDPADEPAAKLLERIKMGRK